MLGDNTGNDLKETFPKKELIPEVRLKKLIPYPRSKVPHEQIDLSNSKIDVKSI
jgi:hypothetical protein